ncbi:unnamed protein product [Pleuronectes platessa]|uniref:Uncharacterized protein n=1 Tax=Pleuronectes platessa TaxID=8262 RepID=A0A9N7W079_PLEPL|nr:unnamed protein product [Pleuronectes platessa]
MRGEKVTMRGKESEGSSRAAGGRSLLQPCTLSVVEHRKSGETEQPVSKCCISFRGSEAAWKARFFDSCINADKRECVSRSSSETSVRSSSSTAQQQQHHQQQRSSH